MSSLAEICDQMTRTSFEIRKEPIPEDVVAILELTCENRQDVKFEELHNTLQSLFINDDWPSVEKSESLYKWIVDYAINPTLVRNDYSPEFFNGPFVEVGTLYSCSPCGLRCHHCNNEIKMLVNDKPYKYIQRKSDLRWTKSASKYIPGYLLPDNQHFYPLQYIGGDLGVENLPAWGVDHKDLLDGDHQILRLL